MNVIFFDYILNDKIISCHGTGWPRSQTVRMARYAGQKVPVSHDHRPCHRSGHTHHGHAQGQNLEKNIINQHILLKLYFLNTPHFG